MRRDRIDFSVIVTSGGAVDVTICTIDTTTTGTIVRIIAEIPNFTNDVTCQISIKDNRGNTIWSVSSLNRNTSHSLVVPSVDVFPGDYLVLSTSGDIGSGANTCYIRLIIDER